MRPTTENLAPGPRRSQASRRTVRYALLGTDYLGQTGVQNLLAMWPDFTPANLGNRSPTDVFIVVAPMLTGAVLHDIRRFTDERSVPVAALLDKVGDTSLLEGIDAGVRGALWRHEITSPLLADFIRAVAAGETWFPEAALRHLVQEFAEMHRNVLAPRGLTASGLEVRDVAVLALLAEGLSTDEIAEQIAYSERMVKNIIAGLLRRWKLRNRTQAVAFAMRSGII